MTQKQMLAELAAIAMKASELARAMEQAGLPRDVWVQTGCLAAQAKHIRRDLPGV